MSRVEVGLTSMMTLVAITIAGLLVRREFFPAPAVPGAVASAPVAVEPMQWQRMLELSHPVSGLGGRVEMVVFSDYECPACKAFHSRVRQLETEMPGVFEVRWAHLPLNYHKFARPAAQLAECSAKHGEFASITQALFAAQDSLGLISWEVLLDRIGSAEAMEILACAETADSPEAKRVAEGRSLAEQISATGTPTVVIEGMMYPRPPSREQLARFSREGMK